MKRLCVAPHLWILAVFFLTGGCSQTITFKLVDGATSRPLAGVHTTLHFEQAGIATNYSHQHVDAGFSSADGSVMVQDVPNGGSWTTTVTFDKPGFYEAGACYAGTNNVTVETRAPPNVGKFKGVGSL